MKLDHAPTAAGSSESAVALSRPAFVRRVMPRAPVTRYAIGGLMAVLSVAARLALEPLWGLKLPLIMFYPAVMVSAWLGGFGPGMTTTLLCAVAADYFWMPPPHSFAVSDTGDIVALVLFVGIGGVISALNEAWRRAVAATAAASERLAITLTSIGDAVIATDTAGRITLMNAVAERLTGWTTGEAIGKPLRDIFAIVNEETRGAVENPVEKVLREGAISGLANHTVLQAKDGREIPIDDSAAPIRAADGRTAGAIMVFREITERRRHEQALGRLAAIVETSEDAIITKSLDGTITSWNRGAERMFGYSAVEAVGRSITILVPCDRVAEETQLLKRVGTGERVEAFETERIAKDGSPLQVSVSLSPLSNGARTIVGVSTIARDITVQARLLAAERAARADADRASRTKDLFLAVLSHELRQPLNTVHGWLRILRRERIDLAQQERALDAIERNTRLQARMIDDLLDIARIEAGKLALERRPLGVNPLVAEVVGSLEHQAEAKELTFETALDPADSMVSADVDRLRQVLMNLLANAMKYTPSGGRIQVRTTPGDTVVRIVVSDTGAGIERDLLPHVFERFRQAEWRSAGTQGGLGLGLAIVRELVEMHGGTVEAQSDGPGRGATFTVTLPTIVG
jgi:PAS domain S-box-containing protein